MSRLFIFFLLMFTGFSQAYASEDPFAQQADFLPVGKAFVFSSEHLPSGETRLQWKIADSYYLYKNVSDLTGSTPRTRLYCHKGWSTVMSFLAPPRFIVTALQS